jgi:hypothetical protein
MRLGGNPFVDEGLRAYFGAPRILVTYLLLPCGLGILLLAVWPRATFEAALRAAQLADTFTAVGVGFLLLLLYLSLRYGSEDYSPQTLLRIREYVTLTPVRVSSVVTGKVSFGLAHTLFLLALGAPLLLASLAVAGVDAAQALLSLAVIGSAGLAARMLGLLVLCGIGGGSLTRDLILLPGMACWQIVSLLFIPAASPISALLELAPRAAGDAAPRVVGPFSSPVFCTLVHLAAACLLVAAVAFVLRGHRRRGAAAVAAQTGNEGASDG